MFAEIAHHPCSVDAWIDFTQKDTTRMNLLFIGANLFACDDLWASAGEAWDAV
jgi:hypothetical protein